MTMPRNSIAARRPRAVFFWTLVLIAGMATAGLPRPARAAGNEAAVHGAPAPAGRSGSAPQPHPAARPVVKPRWSDLTPAQQQALAPLASEWDKLDSFRKHKWLAIGNRFASMKPDEQQRLQERMRDWAKLTPEQRRLARESYARAKRLNRAQKSAQWKKYQQLPEDQKRKLAATAPRKHVAALPTPTAQTRNHKTLPPIKSAPKRVLERSVTPQAASTLPVPPSPQPDNQ